MLFILFNLSLIMTIICGCIMFIMMIDNMSSYNGISVGLVIVVTKVMICILLILILLMVI